MSDLKKWEYKTKTEFDKSNLENTLNYYGEKNYELVNIIEHSNRLLTSYYLIFKRPKQ